jgi:hypothetical protein
MLVHPQNSTNFDRMHNHLISSTLVQSRNSGEVLWRIVGPSPAGPISRFAVKLLILSLFNVIFVVPLASAQNAQPSPTEPLGQPTPTPREEASPTPLGAPTPEPQAVPDLLPESKTLPIPPPETPLPPDLIPPGSKPNSPGIPAPNPASAEQQENDKVRFRQIRTIARRNPFVVYLLRQSKLQRTFEGEREYLRAYYIVLSDQMRKLEPRLKPLIDAFESANVGIVSQYGIRPTIPLRDIRRFEAAQAARNPH